MDALDHNDQIKLGVVGIGIGHNIKDVTNSHIIKGKRTKRQRHQSPLPFPATAAATATAAQSSSSHHPIPSPATSSEFRAGSSPATTITTDEDEDTAMCLILLSKGFSSQEKPTKVENDQDIYKFNSKRYLQPPTTTAATANGKAVAAGIYVYECKTCSRTFPSFQALGGHRASHKKPKTAIDLQEKKPFLALSSSHFSDEEEPPPPPPPPQESSIKRNSSSSSSLSLPLTTRHLFSNNPSNKSPKLHECAICGAEFNSGQALGGHMRRHRLPAGTTTTTAVATPNTALSLVQSGPSETEIEDQKRSRNDGFCLDLNLPAPEDHDHHHHQHDSKFAFASKQEQQQQQPSLILSTRTTLVDCHY